jgi:hypothetical protein
VDKLKKLQQDWKKIGKAKKERELWGRFRAAGQAVFDQRQAQFDFVRQEQRANHKQRQTVCQQVKDSIALLETDAAAARRQFEAARQAWQGIGAGDRKRDAALQRTFNQACKQFESQDRLRQEQAQFEQQASLLRKTALCDALDELIDEALADGVSKEQVQARRDDITGKWSQLPKLKGLDTAVVTRFNRLLDELAAWLASRPVKDAERSSLIRDENLEKMERWCVRMELLAGVESPPEADALRMEVQVEQLADKMQSSANNVSRQHEVTEILQHWVGLGPVPRGMAKPMRERFQRAYQAFEQHQAPVASPEN